MSTVHVGGIDVAYEVHGDGDPLVLLHGSTGGRLHWALIAPQLAACYRVVLVDYAGGGETPDPGRPLEVDELVEEVVAVADAEGFDRFHVGGWSLGAAIATATAGSVPDRVRSLVAVCGWVRPDAYMRFEMDLWQRLLVADEELFNRYALQIGFTPEWFEMMGDAVEAGIGAAPLAPGAVRHAELDSRLDLTERVAAVRAPALVVGASRDQIVPVHHSRALAAALDGSRLVEIDCGHLVVFERAAELGGAMLEFLGGVTE